MWGWTRGAMKQGVAEYNGRERGRFGESSATSVQALWASMRLDMPDGVDPDRGFALKFMLQCSNISRSEILIFAIRYMICNLLIYNKIIFIFYKTQDVFKSCRRVMIQPENTSCASTPIDAARAFP